MRKSILVMFLIVILTFVGCGGSGNNTGSALQNPFIGGTKALTISFADNAPPDQAYAGGTNPFDVVINLKNDGEFTIPKDNVITTLSGINAVEFGKVESNFAKASPEDLQSKRKDGTDIVESNPVAVEFTGLNRLQDFSGASFTIRADVCYKYQTQSVSMMCIRSNNLDTKEGVCKVTESKNIYNSAAPVQVTELKEEPQAKNKVRFTFTIQHKGNGQVFEQGSTCNKETVIREKEDRVWVDVNTGIPGLECSGLSNVTSGYTKLYSGSKAIWCTQTINTNSDYEKQIEIKLTYNYNDNIEKQIYIKKV